MNLLMGGEKEKSGTIEILSLKMGKTSRDSLGIFT